MTLNRSFEALDTEYVLRENDPVEAVVWKRESDGELVVTTNDGLFGEGLSNADTLETAVEEVYGPKEGGSGSSARRSEAGASIVFNAGVIQLSRIVDWTDIHNPHFIGGGGHNFATRFNFRHSDTAGIDLTNTRKPTFEGLDFTVRDDGDGGTVDVGLLMSRDDSGTPVSQWQFDRCSFRQLSSPTIATVYNYAAENGEFKRCEFNLNGGAPDLIVTARNVDDIPGPTKTLASGLQSTLEVSAVETSFFSSGDGTPSVAIEGAGETAFTRCLVGESERYFCRLRQKGTTTTTVEGLFFEGVSFESNLIETEEPDTEAIRLINPSWSECKVGSADATTPDIDLTGGVNGGEIIVENPQFDGSNVFFALHNRDYEFVFDTLRRPVIDLDRERGSPTLMVNNQFKSGGPVRVGSSAAANFDDAVFAGSLPELYIGGKNAFEETGQQSFSGDGSQTVFDLGGLGHEFPSSTRHKMVVEVFPVSNDAADNGPNGISTDPDGDGDWDGGEMRFDSAPPSGTDNITIRWIGQRIAL